MFKSVLIISLFAAYPAFAQDNAVSNKKVIYRKHTEVDLSGETVHGQARMPALFYIFQRKRAGRLEAAQVPESFRFHADETLKMMEGADK